MVGPYVKLWVMEMRFENIRFVATAWLWVKFDLKTAPGKFPTNWLLLRDLACQSQVREMQHILMVEKPFAQYKHRLVLNILGAAQYNLCLLPDILGASLYNHSILLVDTGNRPAQPLSPV